MSEPLRGVVDCLKSIVSRRHWNDVGDAELLRTFNETYDSDVFACLMRRHGPMVMGLARRVVRDQQLAEDVFQATFLILARKAGSIRCRMALPAWLHRVALRLATRARKSRKRLQNEHEHAALPAASNPLDEISVREFLAILDEEIAKLPEKYRLPLILCHLEGLSQEEAAKRLGASPDSIRGMLERGRQMLRKRLSSRGLPGVSLGTLELGGMSHAVSATLIQTTARAAVTSQGASAAAVALAEGAIMMMTMAKIKTVCVVAALVGVVSFGAGWMAVGAGGVEPAKTDAKPPAALEPQAAVQPNKEPGKVVDLYGDLLPEGAVMRLGETRFRPGARVTRLTFSADGSKLASVGRLLYFEDRLSIWDVATGKELRTHALGEGQLSALCLRPGGDGLAVMSTYAESGPLDAFCLWSFLDPNSKPPAPRKPIVGVGGIAIPKGGKFPPRPESYGWFAFSPDGTRLAAFHSGGDLPTGSVEVFEAKPCASGKELKRLAIIDTLLESCSGLRFIRSGAAIMVLSKNMAAPNLPDKAEQSLVIWDIAKNALSEPVTIPIHYHQGQTIDVTEDGSAIAVGLADGSIKIFDLPAGKERLSVKKHDGPSQGAKGTETTAVIFSNGGQNVMSSGRDERQVTWDAKTGANVAVQKGHVASVEAVALSPDGKLVATAGQDALIRLWDTKTWNPVLAPEGPRHNVWRMEVSRDGKYAAGGCVYGMYVWEIASGRHVRSVMSADNKNVATLGCGLFTPDGNLLTCDSEDGLAIFPLPSGQMKRVAVTGRLLDFSSDGKTLLTAQGKDVCIWDWPTCKQRFSVLVNGDPESAAISPDGKIAIIGLKTTNAVMIDLSSGTVTGEIPFKLHWFARSAGFIPGVNIVCGVTSKKTMTWNVVTKSPARPFETALLTNDNVAQHGFLGFAMSADGRRSASCHKDGSVTIYETVTGQVLAHFKGHRAAAIGIAMTPDGNRVLTGGAEDHQVLVWDASLATLAGKVEKLSAADVQKVWEILGTLPAKEAMKTMAALVADPDGSVALLGAKLKVVPTVEAEVLDRIFRELDSPNFAVRDKADSELNTLGAGAIAGMRKRLATTKSAEVMQRVNQFIRRYEAEEITPDRIRYIRSTDVLVAVRTPAARKLLENLAGGAAEAWETEVAKRTFAAMTSGN